MQVTVQFYAVLRDLTRCASAIVEIPDGSDALALLKAIVERYPEIQPYETILRLATETEYIGLEQSIEPDAVIAFIPPVSGG